MAREKLEEDDDGETRRDEESQSGVARAGGYGIGKHMHLLPAPTTPTRPVFFLRVCLRESGRRTH